MAPDGKRRWTGDGRGPGGAPGPKKMARHGGPQAPPPTTTTATTTPRSAYTPMFEQFRDRLDAHHDRRERVVKASRDVTALSKKIIFALQRVRRIHPVLPRDVDAEVTRRLAEIGRLLAGIAPAMQGINRGRYGRVLFGLEELLEALAFRHYLRHQALLSPEEACAQVAALCVAGAPTGAAGVPAGDGDGDGDVPVLCPDDNDFLMGVFDLSGEMMRFATTSAALRGELAADSRGSNDGDAAAAPPRTIVGDMQELDSFFRMLPQRHDKTWKAKAQTLQTSVQKVERLGYDLRVRGSERPKGWVPEAPEALDAGDGASP